MIDLLIKQGYVTRTGPIPHPLLYIRFFYFFNAIAIVFVLLSLFIPAIVSNFSMIVNPYFSIISCISDISIESGSHQFDMLSIPSGTSIYKVPVEFN